ncbi:MAG: Ig-like domain-containing protein [Planctomycetota bacterium]|nr:Ig-like domain-containing protein [Planctomycetota bacterium]
MKPSQLLLGSTLVTCLFLAGCDDPSPIFGGGWPPSGGGDPGSLGALASPPDNGAWIATGAPVLEQLRTTGSGHHSTTPVVLQFSESLASDTLDGAFVLRPINGFAPAPATVHLVGDGRLVVLLPSLALTAGETYSVELDEDAAITDLTGQLFTSSAALGQFTVADTDPTEISLVASWPPTGSTNQSAIGEITAIFDRAVLSTTLTDTSFDVTVGGTPPVFDPAPGAVEVLAGFFPGQDTRVWRWISLDDDGERVDLGASAAVQLSLSPTGSEIADLGGGSLPPTLINFTTSVLSAPTAAALNPAPGDSIGIANLTAGDADELSVVLDYPGALAGDTIGIFLFGTSTGESDNTIAFERTVAVAADGTQQVLTLADLDLVATAAPLAARFKDGVVAMAFNLRRGSITTPMRNLDVSTEENIQDPVLDTVAPELLSVFLEDGEGGPLGSDLRDLVVGGMASEQLRAAEVSTGIGDNGTLTEVLGSQPDGSFLAAPVTLDVVSPASLPLAYTLTIYDQAMNPATIVHAGTFEQRGVVGPLSLVPGANIDVEVFDATTLEPIQGARVFTHRNDSAIYPQVAFSLTTAAGKASPASSGLDTTILTVEAEGYGIVSIIDVEASRVSIPLEPTVPAIGAIAGSLTADSDLAELTLSSLAHRYGDPRRPAELAGYFAGGACTSNPFGGGALDCPFGPETIRFGRVGALSMMAGNYLLPQVSFSAGSALQAFELQLPLAPLAAGGSLLQPLSVTTSLLGEPGAATADLPVELAIVTLDAAGLAGVDLGNLETDVAVEGDAFVSASTRISGVPGAVRVGVGLAYDLGADRYELRTAVPGGVLTGGSYADVVETDLFLEAGFRDTLGASSMRRARASALGSLPTPNELDLEDAPAVVTPTAASSTGMVAYDITIQNSLPDALGMPGMYKVTVVDSAARVWRLWMRDPADGVVPSLHLVDLAGSGGEGLATGAQTARVEAFAAPGFDFGDFLWSDLERDWEVWCAGPPTLYSAP